MRICLGNCSISYKPLCTHEGEASQTQTSLPLELGGFLTFWVINVWLSLVEFLGLTGGILY